MTRVIRSASFCRAVLVLVLVLTAAAVVAAAEPVRIVTLGDSITKGVRSGVAADETFASQLQAMLREKGVECEVTNVGIGGERTDQALKRLAKDVIALKPRAVTIMYGTNDAYVDKGASEPRLTIDQYRDNLRQLVADLRKAGIEPILMTAPRWGDKSPPDGAGDHPNLRLAKYVEACSQVARETKTPLVNNFDHWSKKNATGFDIGQWTTDQYHPNPAGHKVIAETMLPVVLGLLKKNSPAADDELRVLRDGVGPTEPSKMLYNFLLAEAQKHFDKRRAVVAELKTPEDVERRQSELRAKFIESLGGFPAKTPLNARIVGHLKGDGFRVEKVIYESRPNHHVTAALYLPDGTSTESRPNARIPGVLVPCGHSANGKAAEAYQRICILLAKNGLAALCYDPIGQGERYQLLDENGKPLIAGSTTEHSLVGVGALLVGRQTATYRIWDGIRSLDYLASRPEIDPGAPGLGCTGNSGGGTLTAYLMALDDRIVAAAPSCYITSIERLFATIGPQDAEQNITGQVAFGMEHADYVTMRAPRPTLLCIGTQDYFDHTGAWTTFREAKLLYGLLGHGERVDLFEYNDKHGFSRPRREAAMRWMRRWLLGKDDAPVETDFPIFTDAELQCTKSGQVLADLTGRSVFDLNADRATSLARDRSARPHRSTAELLNSVKRTIALPDEIPAARKRLLGTVERDGYTIAKHIFETEPGIFVPAISCGPHENSAPQGMTAIYLNGDGFEQAAAQGAEIERLSRAGFSVLALDLRGMGETSPGRSTAARSSYFGTDSKEAFLSLLLDRPLLGQRVLDVLSVLNTIPTEPNAHDIHIIGVGTAGPIALHAAAIDDRINAVTIKDSISSWSEIVQSPVTRNQLANAIPGVLADYDLPDLEAAIAPRRVVVGDVMKGPER